MSEFEIVQIVLYSVKVLMLWWMLSGILFAALVFLGMTRFMRFDWQILDSLDPYMRAKLFCYLVVMWLFIIMTIFQSGGDDD